MFNPRTTSYIRTFTGRKFDFSQPVEELPFHMCDQAHALSNIARYGGHAKWHYSVATHVLLALQLARQANESLSLCAAIFVHDNSEAYIGDMVRPFKYTPDMTKFREYEDVLEGYLFKHYVPGFDESWHERIKHYDNLILKYEMAQLLVDSTESKNSDLHPPVALTIPRVIPEESEYGYLSEAVALREQGALWIPEAEYQDMQQRMWTLHSSLQPIWSSFDKEFGTDFEKKPLWGV